MQHSIIANGSFMPHLATRGTASTFVSLQVKSSSCFCIYAAQKVPELEWLSSCTLTTMISRRYASNVAKIVGHWARAGVAVMRNGPATTRYIVGLSNSLSLKTGTGSHRHVIVTEGHIYLLPGLREYGIHHVRCCPLTPLALSSRSLPRLPSFIQPAKFVIANSSMRDVLFCILKTSLFKVG